MQLKQITLTGKTSTHEVSDALLVGPVNQVALAQAVRVYLSNQRQGTSKVKTRSEINRTKKKWFRQKGTGNARHGARTPNIFVGGGVSHGPNGEQNWDLTLTRQMKRYGLINALRAQQERGVVVSDLESLDGKTASGQALLRQLDAEAVKVLVILDTTSQPVLRSLRNLPQVLITQASRVNALEVVSADLILFSTEALKQLEHRLLGESSAAVKPVKEAPKAKKTEKVSQPTKKTVAKPKKAAAPQKAVAAKAPKTPKAAAAQVKPSTKTKAPKKTA